MDKTKQEADENQHEQTPKLRFPEFQKAGAWEEILLGNMGEVVTGSTPPTSKREFYDGDFMFVSPADISGLRFIEKTKTTLTEEGFKKCRPVKENSVLFVCIGSIGKVALSSRLCATNQQINSLIVNSEFIASFAYYLLDKESVRIASLAGKQVVPIINKNLFSKVKVTVPSLPEQQKIAACLSSLDELIAAQEQKLETLKKHKKGLMQQLFPAEGETTPKLRFPEFQKAGAWEEKEIGQIFNLKRGCVLSMNLIKFEQTRKFTYPVYSSQTKNNGLTGYYQEFLYEDAITWTTDGANAGDVNYREGRFYCTNVCGVLLEKDGYSGYANLFTASILNSVSKNHVSYVGNPKLMNGVMSKIIIPFPSLPEQQKIAACLSSLDELIAAQEQKLETLKKHKKGLMQQLFPTI